MPEALISIPQRGRGKAVCPAGYVKSSENDAYAYCSYVGAPSAPPASGGKMATSKSTVQTTVSPNIVVSPQISPIFQQQFQPSNSPMTAGTQQVSSPPPQPEPAPPISNNQMPTSGGAGAPINLPPQMPDFESDSPINFAPVSNVEPVVEPVKPFNWLPYILIAGGVGVVALLLSQKKTVYRRRRKTSPKRVTT